MTFRDDVMLPCNLDHYLSCKLIQKLTNCKLTSMICVPTICCMLMYKWNHSNPHIVQVIDNLSCSADRKDRNEWVMTNLQDGQGAVMRDDQDGQDVFISTQDDDEPSRPIQKVQCSLASPELDSSTLREPARFHGQPNQV